MIAARAGSGVDELDLLRATHRGCERSARLLWASCAPRLLAFAGAIVGRHDAEDVVQSVFCSILDLPGARVREIRDAGAFLAAATRRAALNALRLARREQTRRMARPPVGGVDRPAAEGVAQALDRLKRRHREVVVLKHVAGLTFDQIAAALGVPRDTAASRYRAAIAALREELGPDGDRRPGESGAAAAGVLAHA